MNDQETTDLYHATIRRLNRRAQAAESRVASLERQLSALARQVEAADPLRWRATPVPDPVRRAAAVLDSQACERLTNEQRWGKQS